MYRHGSAGCKDCFRYMYVLCRWDKAQRARGDKECLLILIVEKEIIFDCRYLARMSYNKGFNVSFTCLCL